MNTHIDRHGFLSARLAAAAAACLLAACGKSEPLSGPAASTNGTTAPTAQKAAAKKDAGLPELDCPGKVDTALEGFDIVGIKLGMPRADAMNFARCLEKDRNPVVSFEANWIQGLQTYGIQLAPQVFVTQYGDTVDCSYKNFNDMQKCGAGNRQWNHVAEKITVVSPGVPGREKVMGIWRAQKFKPGEMPAAETLLPALVAKYGQPQSTQQTPNAWIRLDWLSDPSGTPLVEGSRGFGNCRRVNARAEDTQQWSEGCGQTLTAMVWLDPQNPLLAKELDVGLVNQQVLYHLTDTLQRDLQAMEAQRRQQQVDQSKNSGVAVKL